MASAGDLITRALRRGRCIGRDQTPSAEDSADGLTALNALLDLWSNDSLLVYQQQQENFSLVAGTASYTIGTGATWSTTRPLKILPGCFVRRNGVDSPVEVLENRQAYDAIPVKTTQGMPSALFYDTGMSNGTVYLYPVPDAADTIYLNTMKRLSTLASLVTSVTLPPGYDELVVTGLAINRCPEYGLSAPGDVKLGFSNAARLIRRMNARIPVMSVDPAILPMRGGYDIYNDQ